MGNHGCKLPLSVCRNREALAAGVAVSILHDQVARSRSKPRPQRNGAFDVEFRLGLILLTENRSDKFQIPLLIRQLDSDRLVPLDDSHP